MSSTDSVFSHFNLRIVSGCLCQVHYENVVHRVCVPLMNVYPWREEKDERGYRNNIYGIHCGEVHFVKRDIRTHTVAAISIFNNWSYKREKNSIGSSRVEENSKSTNFEKGRELLVRAVSRRQQDDDQTTITVHTRVGFRGNKKNRKKSKEKQKHFF